MEVTSVRVVAKIRNVTTPPGQRLLLRSPLQGVPSTLLATLVGPLMIEEEVEVSLDLVFVALIDILVSLFLLLPFFGCPCSQFYCLFARVNFTHYGSVASVAVDGQLLRLKGLDRFIFIEHLCWKLGVRFNNFSILAGIDLLVVAVFKFGSTRRIVLIIHCVKYYRNKRSAAL